MTNNFKMKKHNFLAITSLLLLGASCGDDKKNLFSFDESKFKSMYHTGEIVSLVISNPKEKSIDSIAYYSNDKKIGSAKGNSVFNFELKSEKLGYQNLKAVIYYDGENIETTSRIEMVSSVEPKLLNYKIVGTYPHDIKAYTQGLEFYKGFLYEGTGNGTGNGTGEKGISSLRKN